MCPLFLTSLLEDWALLVPPSFTCEGIVREGHNLARNIKESIYIRVNNPSLNHNIGKFNLSHIWDRVLLNTKGLTLNNQGNNNNNQLTNPH